MRLTHDHVARALRGRFAVDASGDVATTLTPPMPSEMGKAPALVAFVQNIDTGNVLQTLELPLASSACASPR